MFIQHTFSHLLTLVLFLAAPLFASGQETLPQEGHIRYLVRHDWTKKMAAVDYISKQRRERAAYMWGNRSEWKSYTEMFFTATRTKYQDSEERGEPDDEGYSWRKEVFLIMRDFAENTEYEAFSMLGKNYILTDSLYTPDWKILNDMKEIAGHVCMNAYWEDTVKLQKITAWFALDIPISGGPERFCGLPGMILEVDVNNGGMVITADKIEWRKLGAEMDLPKKIKGKKIKEAQFQAMVGEHIAEKRKNDEPPFWGIRY